MDGAGNLYGTVGGGLYGGAIFKLATDGTEHVLYSFCSQLKCADGAGPKGGLIFDGAGNLYGTTLWGGNTHCYNHQGCGTVFRLAPDGTETVLYAFCRKYRAGCPDGANPLTGMTADNAGNLYGTTANDNVFKLAPDDTLTVLHSFCLTDCKDGTNPQGGLIVDSTGNLYGTTYVAGAHGGGTVFKLAPDRKLTVLHSFTNCTESACPDGESPAAPLVMDSSGSIYGTTTSGGIDGGGVLFKLVPRQ